MNTGRSDSWNKVQCYTHSIEKRSYMCQNRDAKLRSSIARCRLLSQRGLFSHFDIMNIDFQLKFISVSLTRANGSGFRLSKKKNNNSANYKLKGNKIAKQMKIKCYTCRHQNNKFRRRSFCIELTHQRCKFKRM